MFRGELPQFAILEPPTSQLVRIQIETNAD